MNRKNRKPQFNPKFDIDKKSNSNDLWIDKYFPQNRNQIPLYTQNQVEKFEKQLDLCFNQYPGSPKVLIITGPVGCGKTTLVKFICKEKNITIKEFCPDEEELPFYNQTSSLFNVKLLFFLERSQSHQLTHRRSLQLLLIDDFSINQSDKSKFIEILTQYNSSQKHLLPLIWIADENDVFQKIPNCYYFSYPAASKTVLTKVLKNIIQCEGLQNAKININEIIDQNPGDVRLAVNSLQFLYSHKFLKDAPISATGKSQNLSYFQALGEILYQKNRLTSEDILKLSHCSPTMMINGLFNNVLDFFVDMSEYASAAEEFSLSDTMLQASWLSPGLEEIATTNVMRSILTSMTIHQKYDFRKMRAGYQSHLKNFAQKSDLYHDEVQIIDLYNIRQTQFLDDDDDDFVNEKGFSCWPSQYSGPQTTSEMMDEVLFNKGTFRYNHQTYEQQLYESRKKDRLAAQLVEQKELLEYDPIEVVDDDDF